MTFDLAVSSSASRRLLSAVLGGLFAIVGVGCTALPQGSVMGFQYDNIVQGNAQRAHAAADAAAEATCDEAAAFRAKAQFEAEAAAGYAQQSTEQVQKLRDAMAQQGTAMSFLADAQQRLGQRWETFLDAKAQFDTHLGGLPVNDFHTIGEVRRDGADYADAMMDYARGLLTVAEDFDILMQTDGDALAAFMPQDVDTAALAADFRQAANDMLSDAIMVGTAEYTVPDNMNLQLKDFKWPDVGKNEFDYTDEYESFQEAMGNLDALGRSFADKHHRSGAFGLWDDVKGMMQDTQSAAEAAMVAATNNIFQLADVTNEHAKAAEDYADQAAAACPDFMIQRNPFGPDNPPPYPDWSSTFWDISSP